MEEYLCLRCGRKIPEEEFKNKTGFGYCYGCFVNHTSECPPVNTKRLLEVCADYDKACVIRDQLDSPVCYYKKRKPQKKETEKPC